LENVKEHFSVCAVGGLDGTVTVWSTSSNRPLAVIEEVFREAVLDLTWSPDGFTLFAVSHDGSVLVSKFNEKSLGVAVPNKLIKCTAGDDELIENALIMKMLEKHKQSVEETGKNKQEEEMEVDEEQREEVELPPQKEVFVNGKRRIIPVRIPTPVKRFKRRIKPKNIFQSKKSLPDLSVTNGSKETRVECVSAPGMKDKLLNRVGGSAAQSGFAKTKLLDRIGGAKAQSTFDKSPTQKSSIICKSPTKLVPPSVRKKNSKGSGKNLKRAPPSNTSEKQQLKKRKIIELDCSVEEKEVEHPREPTLTLTNRSVFLSRKFISVKLNPYPAGGGIQSDVVTTLEARILTRRRYSGEHTYSALTCLKGDQVMWKGEVQGHATVLAGNRMFSAVGTMEGNLFLFCRAGSFLRLPLKLSAEVVNLSLNRKNYLLGITNDGKGHVWRINPTLGELSKLCFNFDISSLLRQPAKTGANIPFSTIWITESSKVLVSRKDRRVFLLDRAMGTWSIVSDGSYWGSYIHPGKIHSQNDSSTSKQPDTLEAIQRKYATERHPFDLANLSDMDSHIHTLYFLERQIAASQAMDLKEEFSSWTMQYMKFLGDSIGDSEILVERLRQQCQKLLSACAEQPEMKESLNAESQIEVDKDDSNITPSFKRGLLRKALPGLITNPALQGLVSRLTKDLELQQKLDSEL